MSLAFPSSYTVKDKQQLTSLSSSIQAPLSLTTSHIITSVFRQHKDISPYLAVGGRDFLRSSFCNEDIHGIRYKNISVT